MRRPLHRVDDFAGFGLRRDPREAERLARAVKADALFEGRPAVLGRPFFETEILNRGAGEAGPGPAVAQDQTLNLQFRPRDDDALPRQQGLCIRVHERQSHHAEAAQGQQVEEDAMAQRRGGLHGAPGGRQPGRAKDEDQKCVGGDAQPFHCWPQKDGYAGVGPLCLNGHIGE